MSIKKSRAQVDSKIVNEYFDNLENYENMLTIPETTAWKKGIIADNLASHRVHEVIRQC